MTRQTLRVACGHCGAARGEPCTNDRGTWVKRIHKGRVPLRAADDGPARREAKRAVINRIAQLLLVPSPTMTLVDMYDEISPLVDRVTREYGKTKA